MSVPSWTNGIRIAWSNAYARRYPVLITRLIAQAQDGDSPEIKTINTVLN